MHINLLTILIMQINYFVVSIFGLNCCLFNNLNWLIETQKITQISAQHLFLAEHDYETHLPTFSCPP